MHDGVMDKLAEQYPTVSRNNLEDVWGRFYDLLEEALVEEEQKAGPGTKVEVQLR